MAISNIGFPPSPIDLGISDILPKLPKSQNFPKNKFTDFPKNDPKICKNNHKNRKNNSKNCNLSQKL